METHVGFYFKKISEKLDKRANEEGRRRDVTYSQGKILWYLHKHADEQVTMRDMEKYFDCSHATVFGLVKRLEEKGRVELVPDTRDKRAKVVRLTDLQQNTFARLKAQRMRVEEILLKGFTDREKQVFLEYLDRIYKNLE